MARGGSRGRRSSYVRDNSGRFASTPGGGPPKRSTPASRRAARAKVTGGTLGARSSLRRSRAKLAGKNPTDRSLQGTLSLRAQKGAVTRGANRLGKVRAASTVRMAGKGPAGVIRGGRKVAGKPVASAPPKDYRRGRSAAAGYKPKADGTRASSQVGTRAKLSEFQRAEAQTAKQRFGVRSTAQSARVRAGSYDPAKQGGGRQVFRTRAEARKAYLKRAAATKSTASKSYNDGRYVGDGVKTGTKGSARIRTAAVAQGNLLSGKADNVKARKVRSLSGRSALGGAMRRAAAKSAKPVVAPRSSVRVIRPSRPAMRPGPGPDRGKISEYVDAVRGSRRWLSSAKPGSANAAEAKQGLKDNRRALSRRIQRERGARRGLKPATSQQVLTGTVPAPPARRAKAARPAGTVAKPRGLKVGAIAGRKAPGRQGQRQRAEARAIANYNRSIKAQPETKKQAGRAAIGQVTATRAVEFLRGVKRIGPQRGMTSRVLPKGFVPQSRPGVPAPSPQPQTDRKPSGGSQKPKRKTAAQKPTRSPSRLPQETRSALRDIAGRRVQAEQALTGQIQKLGGITKQQAQAVFSYYSKRKLIKSQGIDNVGVRSGNLLDRDTIRQALQLAQEPAQPRKPSPKGAGPRMKAARPAGTVAKPRGLKPDRWIKKERVIGKGEVWMGKWTPPSGGKAKRRKPKAAPQRKPKSAEDFIAQSNRIDQRSRRMSRAARTGFRARQIESRAEGAVKAARARAIELSKPKPESKTAKAKRERAERVRAREQAVNTSRLIMDARRRRR